MILPIAEIDRHNSSLTFHEAPTATCLSFCLHLATASQALTFYSLCHILLQDEWPMPRGFSSLTVCQPPSKSFQNFKDDRNERINPAMMACVIESIVPGFLRFKVFTIRSRSAFFWWSLSVIAFLTFKLYRSNSKIKWGSRSSFHFRKIRSKKKKKKEANYIKGVCDWHNSL